MHSWQAQNSFLGVCYQSPEVFRLDAGKKWVSRKSIKVQEMAGNFQNEGM